MIAVAYKQFLSGLKSKFIDYLNFNRSKSFPSPATISRSAQIRTPPSIVQSQFGSFAWFIMSKTGTNDPQSPSFTSNQSGKN